ncbi:MAG: hypothetical protein NW223_02210 [Hyphomicrobiaceae bacterium]|nr:hypothetical protein [Hyphomicrobiaceae bacterium]
MSSTAKRKPDETGDQHKSKWSSNSLMARLLELEQRRLDTETKKRKVKAAAGN